MSKVVFCVLLWLLHSCNSQPKETIEITSAENSNSGTPPTDTFTASENWKNDPAFLDSMRPEIEKALDRYNEEMREREKSKYTSQDDLEMEYCLNAEDYIVLENVDVKYNDNYIPVMHLTINNRTGLTLKSIKLIVDGRSQKRGTDDNIFTFKKTIPAKGKINVSFNVKDNVTVKDVYFYSFVTSNGKLGESRIALSDYVKKYYP